VRGGIGCISKGEGGGTGLGATDRKSGGGIEAIEDGGVVGDASAREGGEVIASKVL